MMKIEPRKAWVYILGGAVLAVIVLYVIVSILPENTLPEKNKGQQDEQSNNELLGRQDITDLQMTACTAAEKGGTCNTRLPKLGLIKPEDCCKLFGKCC